MRDQHMRLVRWESAAACRRCDAVEDTPCVDVSDFVEAKRRIPPELVASWGPVADAIVCAVCARRINGEETSTDRVDGWSTWSLQAIPKPRRVLDLLLIRRPLCM